MQLSRIAVALSLLVARADADVVAAVRGGIARSHDELNDVEVSDAGWFVDAQLGWRFRWWLEVVGFVQERRYTEHNFNLYGPNLIPKDVEPYAFGARVVYSPIERLQVGIGIGKQVDSANAQSGFLVELSAGVTLVRLDHFTLDAVASGGHARYGGAAGRESVTGAIALGLGVSL
jgi:hypothetical protein